MLKKRNGGRYGNDMKPKAYLSYKVTHLEDNIYQVTERIEIIEKRLIEYIQGKNGNSVLFQGTLPECEAWINLKEKGYM